MKPVLHLLWLGPLCLYLVACLALYLTQERLIFHPEKLPPGHRFDFTRPFEELGIRTADGETLSALLFKTGSPRGVIFYLHGNAGSLETWGGVAGVYLDLGYDVFMLDYRGYGKSTGAIDGEARFFADAQAAWDVLKTRYDEGRIVVLGYSIGTGTAAKLAADNAPGLLILQAPYSSLVDLTGELLPFVPGFILRYRFETSTYLSRCRAPVVIFHGDADRVIPYASSVKLSLGFKPGDRLVTLHGQGHDGMSENAEYRAALAEVLAR